MSQTCSHDLKGGVSMHNAIGRITNCSFKGFLSFRVALTARTACTRVMHMCHCLGVYTHGRRHCGQDKRHACKHMRLESHLWCRPPPPDRLSTSISTAKVGGITAAVLHNHAPGATMSVCRLGPEWAEQLDTAHHLLVTACALKAGCSSKDFCALRAGVAIVPRATYRVDT